MTPQEYITAFSFLAFTLLMTGGIGVAVFWHPKKKTEEAQQASAQSVSYAKETA